MKRILLIAYWVVAVLLVAIALSSLDYKFWEALLIGTLFLPGALAAKYFFPKVNYNDRRAGIRDTAFVVLGILTAELFLFLAAHYYICTLRDRPELPFAFRDIPHILTNPVFVAFILTALAAGCHFFESWLDKKFPGRNDSISFNSERKQVKLNIDEIVYVESNDDVTTVVATEGRHFKNYTPISRWEAILSPRFIRIHRSYLVNKTKVTRIDVDLLYIGDIQLPISRKYKDAVNNL